MLDPADLCVGGSRVRTTAPAEDVVAVSGTLTELQEDLEVEGMKGSIEGKYFVSTHVALRFGQEGRAAWQSQGPNSCDYEVPRHGGTRSQT